MNSEVLANTANSINSACAGDSAAAIIISIVPVLGVVLGAVLLFFFFLWQYRFRKELIKADQYHPRMWDHLRIISLLIGSISSFIGLPMFLLFYFIDGLAYSALGGLIPLSAGLGLLAFYYISGKSRV